VIALFLHLAQRFPELALYQLNLRMQALPELFPRLGQFVGTVCLLVFRSAPLLCWDASVRKRLGRISALKRRVTSWNLTCEFNVARSFGSSSPQGGEVKHLLVVLSNLPRMTAQRRAALNAKTERSPEDMHRTASSLIQDATQAFMKRHGVDRETALRWIVTTAVESLTQRPAQPPT
jgi:hypothetical protein